MQISIKKLNQKGFTLTELMVSATIFPMIFLTIYGVMDTARVVLTTNDVYSRLNTSAMQTLRYVSREIGQTSPNTTPSHINISTDGNNNSIVRFQIPVDWDNDGDADTGGLDPDVEWGAYDDASRYTSGRLSAWVRYSVTNNQLNREVLDSSFNVLTSHSKVVANNVQLFTVSQSQNIVTMNLTLQATDRVAENGGQRNLQATFSTATVLRNAVA